MKLKDLMSYIVPFVVETKEGGLTSYLEVIKSNGNYQLNSASANYSYGGLHTIFLNVFKKIGFHNYDFKSVLILGLGGGSIVSLITETFGKDPEITGIEGDRVVIDFANKYFNIDRFKKLQIIQEDAFEYVNQCNTTYDLIIIDLFVDDEVPEKFHREEFVKAIRKIAAENSVVLFNKMTHRTKFKNELRALECRFKKEFVNVDIIQIRIYGVENSILFCNSMPSATAVTQVCVNEMDRTLPNFISEKLKPDNLIPRLVCG